MMEIHSFDTFKDKGKNGKAPEGHKRIKVHMVCAIKHDGRHKARLVANGNVTNPPCDGVCSGVASLRSVRFVAFLAELNGMELWAADVSNAYLESYTVEKACIIAGPEFGELEGRSLIVVRALCGLGLGGVSWHIRLEVVLKDLGFFECKMDPDVWMRDMGNHHEHVGTYVDDLEIASKKPKEIFDALTGEHKFKLKGVGPIFTVMRMEIFVRIRRHVS